MSLRLLTSTESAELFPVAWRNMGRAEPALAPVPQPHHPAEPPANPSAPPEEMMLAKEVEQIRQAAYHEGFRTAEEQCRQTVEREVAGLIDRLGKSLAEVAALRLRVRREADEDLAKLSIAIARRVLHREVQIDPEALEGIVKAALARLNAQSCLRVRVHPSQKPALESILAKCNAVSDITVQADHSLQAGDMLFDAERGTLDASVEAQLKEIERGFCDRLKAGN